MSKLSSQQIKSIKKSLRVVKDLVRTIEILDSEYDEISISITDESMDLIELHIKTILYAVKNHKGPLPQEDPKETQKE